MNAARASIEVQIIIAIGAIFALMVFDAAVCWWYATSSDLDRRRPR